jgi:hypothetical protein
MARRRRIWRIGEGTWVIGETRPRPVKGAEALALLREMLEARRAGALRAKAGTYLTARERRERAKKAAAARWGKRETEA